MDNSRDYVYGSTARKIDYDVYQHNPVLKKKKLAKSYRKAKLKTVLMTLTAFGLGLLLIYRYALIIEANYMIHDLQKTYNAICNENSVLKVDLEKQMDLSEIKSAAENRLGMHKPSREQIVYVRVPKNDTTTVSAEYLNEDNPNKGFLSVVAEKITEFLEFLY